MAKSVQFNAQAFQQAVMNALAETMKNKILPIFKQLIQDEYRRAHPQKKKWGENVANKVVKGRIETDGNKVTGYIKLRENTGIYTWVRAVVMDSGNNHNGP